MLFPPHSRPPRVPPSALKTPPQKQWNMLQAVRSATLVESFRIRGTQDWRAITTPCTHTHTVNTSGVPAAEGARGRPRWGGRGRGRLPLKRGILVTPKPHWPPFGGGLSMAAIPGPDGPEFEYVYSGNYSAVQQIYEDAQVHATAQAHAGGRPGVRTYASARCALHVWGGRAWTVLDARAPAPGQCLFACGKGVGKYHVFDS